MIERVKHKLDGKKVLFIAAKFYHYTEAVYSKLKSYNADVTFYYERDTSLKHVIIANFFSNKMETWQDNHYKKILKETANQTFDYLIVIRGYKMSNWFVDELRKRNPSIYTIMYQWDLYSLWDADYRHLMRSFHKTLSFDYNDCATLNIPYAPTFHMDEYANIQNHPSTFDFIYCSNHTDEKYEFMNTFLKYAAERGLKVRTHLYMSWLKYIKETFKGNKIDYHKVSFRRLNRHEYFKLFCQSKTVVDFSASMQSGLTMRVIDALGSGKRIMTNNPNVTNEPGFNPQQVIIYDVKNFALPDFILDDEAFEKQDYSIDKWLDNLFFAS